MALPLVTGRPCRSLPRSTQPRQQFITTQVAALPQGSLTRRPIITRPRSCSSTRRWLSPPARPASAMASPRRRSSATPATSQSLGARRPSRPISPGSAPRPHRLPRPRRLHQASRRVRSRQPTSARGGLSLRLNSPLSLRRLRTSPLTDGHLRQARCRPRRLTESTRL